MSSSELVQRRGHQGQPAAQPAVGGDQAAAAAMKTWQQWMLFGLGWPSILLFFLSLIPSFSPKTQGLLITFGWLFCGCWWAGTAAGLLTDNKTRKQDVVFKANLIVTGIGSVIGLVLLASYAYYNWPWLYIAGFVAVVAAVFAVRSLDDGSGNKGAADAGGAAGTDNAAAAAAEHQE